MNLNVGFHHGRTWLRKMVARAVGARTLSISIVEKHSDASHLGPVSRGSSTSFQGRETPERRPERNEQTRKNAEANGLHFVLGTTDDEIMNATAIRWVSVAF